MEQTYDDIIEEKEIISKKRQKCVYLEPEPIIEKVKNFRFRIENLPSIIRKKEKIFNETDEKFKTRVFFLNKMIDELVMNFHCYEITVRKVYDAKDITKEQFQFIENVLNNNGIRLRKALNIRTEYYKKEDDNDK